MSPADPYSVVVVIPAYLAADTIERAIESVLGQTRLPDEIVVVDDGSPEDLGPTLARFGGLVTLIRKPNGGASSARNLGIERSSAALIAFLDADDYWEPEKLERQVNVLIQHPEVGLVASHYYLQTPGYLPAEVSRSAPQIFGATLRPRGPEVFLVATHISTCSVIVRRSTLAEHRFDTGLRTGEDIDLWIRIASTCPTFLIDEPLATAVEVPGSLSRSDPNADYPNMLRLIERYSELLDPASQRAWRIDVYRRWAAAHLGHNRPRCALKPAYQRLRYQPLSPEGWWVFLKSAISPIAQHFRDGGTRA